MAKMFSTLSIISFLLLFLSCASKNIEKKLEDKGGKLEPKIILEVKEPFNGAIFNKNYDEVVTTKEIEIYVRGIVFGANKVIINRELAKVKNGEFEKLITLSNKKEEIVITAKNGIREISETITIFVDRDSFKRYDYSVDDVLYILYDLHLNRNKYKSIFQQPEFKFFKEMHERYGIKVSLYLFYKGGYDMPSNWTLTDMTSKYKSEFQNNAHWLRFSFHALSNYPSYPYVSTDYATAQRHFDMIKTEVERFAGVQSWSNFTRVHYWTGSIEAIRAWRDRGIRGFFASNNNNDKGDIYNSYYMKIGSEKWNYINANDYWMDVKHSVFFFQTDLWIEKTANIVATLNQLLNRPKESEVISIFQHDTKKASGGLRSIYGKKKAEEAFRWFANHGYIPVFHDDFLKEE